MSYKEKDNGKHCLMRVAQQNVIWQHSLIHEFSMLPQSYHVEISSRTFNFVTRSCFVTVPPHIMRQPTQCGF